MKLYSIKQPTGRFLYGTIVAPIAAIAYIVIFVLVSILVEIEFVFGIIGALSCLVFSFFLFKAWRANLYEYRMITKSNPIPIIIEDGIIKGYQVTKLDSFDYNKPITIDLSIAKFIEPKGAIVNTIRIEDEENKMSFNSSMKFIEGSFDEFKADVLRSKPSVNQ